MCSLANVRALRGISTEKKPLSLSRRHKMGRVYLCRHGETEWSLSGQHTSVTDLSLTKKGEEQARLLRKRIEGVEFEKIFTRPRKRARHTCKGLDGSADEDLVE